VTDPRLSEPGLQPERTALAWRRSILALIVGSALALRLLPPLLGRWSLAIGVVGLLATSGLWAASAVRVRRVQAALAAGVPLPGGLLIALLAGVIAATAAASLALVLVLGP
jgi:uncharacterized membrane protein YidH (DUF202 family)